MKTKEPSFRQQKTAVPCRSLLIIGLNALLFFQILTRTKSAQEPSISGFSSIIQSLIRESKKSSVRQAHSDLETECQILQWLDYAVLFVAPSNKDKHTAKSLLDVSFIMAPRWWEDCSKTSVNPFFRNLISTCKADPIW